MQLSRDELIRAYRQMQTIRSFEERLHTEITTGEIAGFTHLYAGQEAIAVGVCEHLGKDDFIVSTHRGHGHCIAKGCDVKGMMKEIYGRRDGLCKGKGGSMHIADFDIGMLGANGIVGGGPPIAVGAAIAAKLDGKGHVSASFGGDGSSNQGTVFEAMNLAVVLQVPTIFVFEDNGYGEHTGGSYAVGAKSLAERCAGFGLTVREADGNDFFAVYETMREIIALARGGGGPSAVILKTARYYGHFEGDPQKYRADGEVEKARATNDCLARFREKVLASKLLDTAALDEVDKAVAALIDAAVSEARAAPPPDPADVTEDVYISY
jgi:TPP-dependent pyruvate/acetoin dehydrogenase alpha subunit